MPDRKTILTLAVLIATICLIISLAVGIPSSQRVDNLSRAKILLEKYPLIDTHNDLPLVIRENFMNQLGKFDLEDMTKYVLNSTENITHTDFRRLKEGKLAGQFWSVYAHCSTMGKDAIRYHMEQIDVVLRLIQKYPDHFQFAQSYDDVINAFKNKKIASLLGVESAHAIDSSLGILRMFYNLGVRYMTLTHNCDVPWATNNLIDKLSNASAYGGLTLFGRTVIKEMNRIGMIVDISHVSTQTMVDVLEETKAPVIFSHSSVYSLCNHTRNVKDHILDKLKINNGVIMINFFNKFLTCQETASLKDVVEHINYVKNRIGPDHVGIGADYDGVNFVPTGLEDVSKYPNLFAALLDEGWSEADIAKLAGGNILRVLKTVEEFSISVKNLPPYDDVIDQRYLQNPNYKNCRTSF